MGLMRVGFVLSKIKRNMMRKLLYNFLYGLLKDVMDDEIAISRPEQRNIKDGAKRFRAKKSL
jgi:hypothetical protein